MEHSNAIQLDSVVSLIQETARLYLSWGSKVSILLPAHRYFPPLLLPVLPQLYQARNAMNLKNKQVHMQIWFRTFYVTVLPS
jgi:hypothetical protein